MNSCTNRHNLHDNRCAENSDQKFAVTQVTSHMFLYGSGDRFVAVSESSCQE
jgi:hypothetical protein